VKEMISTVIGTPQPGFTSADRPIAKDEILCEERQKMQKERKLQNFFIFEGVALPLERKSFRKA
jgi:hypothetical protein